MSQLDIRIDALGHQNEAELKEWEKGPAAVNAYRDELLSLSAKALAAKTHLSGDATTVFRRGRRSWKWSTSSTMPLMRA